MLQVCGPATAQVRTRARRIPRSDTDYPIGPIDQARHRPRRRNEQKLLRPRFAVCCADKTKLREPRRSGWRLSTA